MYTGTLRRGTLLYYLADMTVGSIIATNRVLEQRLPPRRRAKRVVACVAAELLRCSMSYGLAPLCMAAAALVRPCGAATRIGQIAAETLSAVLALRLLQRLIAV